MDLETMAKNLELIPCLVGEIKQLKEQIARMSPPITSKKDVAKFLDVTPRTINNYITQGYLVEGIHFYRKGAKILVFIEDAILDFREQLKRGMVIDEKVAI